MAKKAAKKAAKKVAKKSVKKAAKKAVKKVAKALGPKQHPVSTKSVRRSLKSYEKKLRAYVNEVDPSFQPALDRLVKAIDEMPLCFPTEPPSDESPFKP
jgi:hypothetical protein